MLTRIEGGRIIDPANGRDEIGDIWMRDGRIVDAPPGASADATYDATGKIVMAGAIDIHSHIAGWNVNTARLLLPEFRLGSPARPGAKPLSSAGWPAFEIGCLYAAMGFTTVVEPAVSPHYALHAHLELADIPIIDKATLAVLGNDDFLLGLIHRKEDRAAVQDYVAWTLGATRSLGVKVINPGGAAAFKENVRTFSFDDVVPSCGVSSREIVKTLQHAVNALGVPHPLHVHCNNLGIAGSADTALTTIAAAEGLPLHLAHLQFYGYGKEGGRGFSSEAARLAEAVNAAKSVTIDVGQVMFGQTVTVSLDVLRQFNARNQARPRKWAILDGDGNGAGIVPYNYRSADFYNAVQWAVGMELFLLIDDPWRVFFTTDHPNGAPFTAYPEILALLMSRDLRAQWMAGLPAEAVAVTTLPSISREYTFTEIATMTRAAPARLLGLRDRGHLGAGAIADVAVYEDERDRARMFRAAALVFRRGELVVRDGKPTKQVFGCALAVEPERDRAIDRRLKAYYEERYGISDDIIKVPDHAIGRPAPFELISCAH
ncbi:MAG TPA: formylmethanofuran dehydrogenase subunit A [Xanthobacteraceae bacterium]|jgi:formylmethanofuran dehydrogenase subunit A|nr:formylmethanofuran dehydrogenase subunit A [Xanthobacteraceae bacterium]